MDPRISLNSKKIYPVTLLIAFLTLIIYLPALNNDFVNWDDPDYVYENLHIRSLDFQFIKWIFTTFHMQNWHPVTWLSHGVDYAVWGLSPLGHHLTSIILHALNSSLVVIITICLFKKRLLIKESVSPDDSKYEKTSLLAASITGLLFALHPLHVESVAWVSERKDVLCAFFFLLSILSYLRYVSLLSNKKKNSGYILCLFFFILALMSKPMAVTLPFVLLILDIYPFGRLKFRFAFTRQGKVILEKIPFFLLSCAIVAIYVFAQQKEIAYFETNLGERILVANKALIFYLLKMLWPTNLSPIYPYPSDISFLSFPYLASTILIACITFFCIWSGKKQKVVPAVWFFYVVMLLPVLGIIKIGQQAAADRYTYLPGIGPMLLAGLAISSIWDKVSFNRKRLMLKTIIVTGLITVMLSILSILTLNQIKIWRNSVTLWSRELQSYSIPTAYNNRGNAYVALGKYQEAVDDYNEAIKLDPGFTKAYVNRGVAYNNLGEYKSGLQDFNHAINLDIQNSSVYFNRANVYKNMGLYENALDDYTNAIELDPENVDAYNNRGTTYLRLEKLNKAIEDFTSAIKLDSEYEKSYANRAIAYEKLGKYDKAIKDYRISANLGNKEVQEYLQSKGIGW